LNRAVQQSIVLCPANRSAGSSGRTISALS
jgi:hypothetical protein